MKVLSGPLYIDPTPIVPEGYHVVSRSNRLRTEEGTFKLPGTPVALARRAVEGEDVPDEARIVTLDPVTMKDIVYVRVVNIVA